MNSLLSGLASSQKPGNKCDNDNGIGGIGGFGGGNSIIWIIILLFLCGGFGQGIGGVGTGTVCACKKKHCKEYCKCGFDNEVGGIGGFGGCGGLGGFGGGNGCWWIIILIFLFAFNGNQKKGCTTKIINLDDNDE